MSDDSASRVGHRHLNESVLYAYAQGDLEGDARGEVESHLERCLACRVWTARLRHASVSDPNDAVISRLVDVSPSVPAALHKALTTKQARRAPHVGEIWRVGLHEALLVWVARILDDSAIVIPVVFDEDLADDLSLIVPSEESPLDTALVLLTSVEGHVDLGGFRQFIGSLNAEESVDMIRQARKEHHPVPPSLLVGPPIMSEDDQRLEYRQVVADLLAELSPRAFAESDGAALEDEGFDIHSFVDELGHLTWRRAGVRIQLCDLKSLAVDPAHELLVVALVEDLDVSVLVALLSGAHPAQTLDQPAVSAACGTLLRESPEADHVAVAIPDSDWTTVVIDAPSAMRAVELPAGRFEEPRVPSQPLPLVDALLKHLDAYAARWELEETVQFEKEPVDLGALGSTLATQAIGRLVASGRRSRPPKREVYVAFGEQEAQRVTELIRQVAAHRIDAADAVDVLLEGEQP